MNTFMYLLQEGVAPTGGSSAVQFVMIGAVALIFYFFLIRPQSKKQKETKAMLAALKKGDKVVSIGGIHGTVTNLQDDIVVVKVDDGAKIKFAKNAIATVLTKKDAEVDTTKA
jgi:preprotein translocase subunit YajC